ncbi:ABC transporter permease subunit [Kozakia baliensis]|uniref:ABC transporter permease subunit n=1 Tax=Kozakia baliensis TaxID=153496 RepID=UPI00345C0AE7
MAPLLAASGSILRKSARSLSFSLACAAAFMVVLAVASRCHLPQTSEAPQPPADFGWETLLFGVLATVARLFGATLLALAMAFLIAVTAVKTQFAQGILRSFVNVLRETPVLGFLPFLKFLGTEISVVGLTAAALVWNMSHALMKALENVPTDLEEAARGLGLTSWQRLWRLEAPFAIPALVAALAASMPTAWMALIAAEMLSIAGSAPVSPGVGAYAAVAALHNNVVALVELAVIMALIVAVYDLALMRPWQSWSMRYRLDSGSDVSDPWMLSIWRRSQSVKWLGEKIRRGLAWIGGMPFGARRPRLLRKSFFFVPYSVGSAISVGICMAALLAFVGHQELRLIDLAVVTELGLLTAYRVLLVVLFSCLIWLPIGVWLGLRSETAQRFQPLMRLLALYPVNIVFPLAGWAAWHDSRLFASLWPEILIFLGAQWAVLAHILKGMRAFPDDLLQAARNMNVSGMLWWRRVLLPGLAPHILTGFMASSTVAWNIAILAEMVTWYGDAFFAPGLGQYIAQKMWSGDLPHIALGIAALCLYMVMMKRLLWQPLYGQIERRFNSPALRSRD